MTTTRGLGAAAGVAVGLLFALVPSPTSAADAVVWVVFDDRGRGPAQLEAELAAREAALPERTKRRRAKVRAPGEIVDASDLPPARGYVAAVEAEGGRLRTQSRWLNAISIEVDSDALARIEALPFVARVQPVARASGLDPIAPGPFPSPTADPDDYGPAWDHLDMIGVPELHDCGLTGAGVVLGVQDTGFVLDHAALVGTEVLATYDFLGDDPEVGIEDGDPGNQHVHGTLVLALITGDDPGNYLGVAPGVSVLLSKTEDTSTEEPFEEDRFVEGLEWIEAMGADIFTASLNYTDWYVPDDFDGATAITTIAVEAAVANGLIVFASMGNAGPEPTTLGAPADAEHVISVGATNPQGNVTNFSSRGPTADGRIKPDIVAPGAGVFTVEVDTLDGYAPANGTSISTPVAAGVAALLLEADPSLTPADMAELLRTTASQADAPDNDAGYGLIDAVAAVGLYCSCTDADEDGHFDEACGGTDCDDQLASTHPGADELCNGLDDDCDGQPGADEVDEDDDGHRVCDGDCDDTDPGAHPDASEVCDNQTDDDCDGLTDDEDPDCATASESGEGEGEGEGESDSEGATEDASDSAGTDGDATDDGAGGDGGAGCGCTTTPAPAGLGLGLLLLAFVRRGSAPRQEP